MTNRQAFSSSLLTLLLASGCVDFEPDERTAARTAALVNGPCHVPEELDQIDMAPWFCALDVDCPCGSRCEQGLCTYDCRSDGDCVAGRVCDDLGTCSTPGEIPPPPPDERLVVSPDTLAFTVRDVPRRLEITAPSAIASATVSVPDGLEVECDPTSSGTGGPDCDCSVNPCTLDGFGAGDTAVLWVRVAAAGALPVPASWELSVASASNTIGVPVELVEVTAALDGIAGHYAGTARMAQASIFGDGEGAALQDHRFAVTADVQEQGTGAYRVALRASNQMIGATGVAVGTLQCPSPGSCTLSIDSADQEAAADRKAPLLVGSGAQVSAEGGVIRGAIDLQAYGTMSRNNTPQVRWELTLQRTTDPGQGVPVAQTGHSLPTFEDMMPWEKMVAESSSEVARHQHPMCVGDLIFGYCMDWLKEMYHRHAAALMSSTSTVQCEWQGTYPAEFIPCKSNDHPWGPDACPEYAQYGCTVGTWTTPTGFVVNGCWLHPPASVQVADKDKALVCSQRYLCSHTPTLEELEEEGLPLDTVLQLGGDEFTVATMQNGDLKCGPTAEGSAGAYIPDSIGLFTNADRGTPLEVSEMMEACLTDLRAQPADRMTVPELFYSEGCINRARFERAIGWASRDARDRLTTFPTPVPDDEQEAADALFVRLLQQWIEVHMFLAREGMQQAVLAEVLATDPKDPEFFTARDKPQLVEVLQVMEAGWSQLLHPRWADPLGMVTGDVLAEPDYRKRPFSPWVWGEELQVPTRPEDQQKVGLPATMLEGMTAYLEVLARHLEAAGSSGSTADRASALAYLGPAMRFAAVTDAITAGLSKRAGGGGAWADQYAIARSEMGVAWARAAALGLALADGTNPLGIEDEDLPLYFGDPIGTTAEFFAASLYTLSIANEAIGDASQSLGGARSSWSTWQSQKWQDRMSSLSLGGRVADAKERHGRVVQQMCGARNGLPSADVLDWIDRSPRDGAPDVPAEVCYIDVADPSCQAVPAEIDGALDAATEADIRYGLCLAHKNRTTWRAYRDYFGGSATPTDLETLLDGLAAGDYGIPFTINGDTITFQHDQQSFEVDRADILTVGSFRADHVAECSQQFPGGDSVALGALPSSPASNPSCYHGRLGELAVGIQSAGKRLDIARQEMLDHIEHYRLGTEACLIQAEIHDDMSVARARHEGAMRGLREARREAQYTYSAVSAFVGFFSSAVTLLASQGSGGGGGIISNWAYMAGLHELESNVHALNDKMADATLQHNNMMADLQSRIADLSCFAGAEHHLVGVKAASLRYQEAWIEATRAVVQFNNGKAEVELAVRDGYAAVERESAPLPILAHEHWLDESLETFDRDMRWARRTTYLAARAVEYETQQSLALTQDVLRARHPDELATLHRALDAEVLPRGLGARPSQMPMVVSLCSYLRSLDDAMPTTAACDPTWFRRYLTDPAFAQFDDAGAYQGQLVPFTLRPYGIQLQDDCAERMWSVSASIIGAGVNFTGTPTVRVDLMKSNTFVSQWCDASAQEADFQVASTRPCRNLFLEAGPISAESPPASCSETGWAKGRITARFDTPQGFYDNTDYQPSTDELAGRGLYGEYALYIPASVIRHGSQTSGIALENIEDVLLRFSYNSVAKQ